MPHQPGQLAERLHLELGDGVELDVTLRVPQHRPHRPALALEVQHAGVHFTGRDLHVNLHDNKSATLSVVESDALGFAVTGDDAVPVTFSVEDSSVVTLTDNGDGTARIDNVTPPAVGSTTVVHAVASLSDGTEAQGQLAVTVVSGPVTSIEIQADEVDPSA